MNISDTVPPFLKQSPYSANPFPFYGKNLNPIFLEKFRKLRQPLYKGVGSNYEHSILDAWQGFEYASENCQSVWRASINLK